MQVSAQPIVPPIIDDVSRRIADVEARANVSAGLASEAMVGIMGPPFGMSPPLLRFGSLTAHPNGFMPSPMANDGHRPINAFSNGGTGIGNGVINPIFTGMQAAQAVQEDERGKMVMGDHAPTPIEAVSEIVPEGLLPRDDDGMEDGEYVGDEVESVEAQ
jgi:hypothetical protein